MIHFLIFEAIKLNLSSQASLNSQNKSIGDIVASSMTLLFISIMPIIFYFVLKKNRNKLHEKEIIETIGQLYVDRNVQ